MAKLKNCFQSTIGKGDEIKSFLATNNGGLLTSTTNGGKESLDVHIAGSDINIDVDLDGVYNAGTNANPDNVGAIFHTRSASLDDTAQTLRTTGGALGDVLAAAAANISALDTNAFLMGFDGTDYQQVAVDTDGNLQVDIAGVTFASKGDSLKVVDTYAGLTTAQTTVAGIAVPVETQVAKGTNQGRIRIQNTGDNDIYIGPTGVADTTGYPLPPCAEFDLPLCEDLYVISAANETISYSTLQLTV